MLGALHDGADQDDAVRVGEVVMGRHQLLGAAAAVAERVDGAGCVAVAATATPETVVAVLGALLAGVPVVPVPADAGPDERRHVLRDSGAHLWLGPRPDDVDLPAVGVDLHAAGSPPVEPPPGATALILYTSGTTGPPKGVVLSRAAIARGLDAVADAWAWTPDDVLVHGLPLFHVHGLVLGVLGAVRVGSPLVHTVRPTPAAYAAAGGSLYFGVPTVWARVAAEPTRARGLGGARLLVSGSAPLPVTTFDALTALTGRPPLERYGMSETLITVSARADEPRRAGWVGRAVPGTRTRLRGPDGGPVACDGESLGALQVKGPSLFDAYLGRPDATAAAWTPDGWFDTGDIAVIDADGDHRIVGRESTDLIKTGGYRVGAGEVEVAVAADARVGEVAVVGVHDADLGQRIVAYVVLSPGATQPGADELAPGLARHKRPREVRVVEAMPRNAMGKVQKGRLPTGRAREGGLRQARRPGAGNTD